MAAPIRESQERMWTHKEVCCHGHLVWAVLFLDATNCMQATYWDPVTMTTSAARTAGVEKQNRGRGEAEWDEGS